MINAVKKEKRKLIKNTIIFDFFFKNTAFLMTRKGKSLQKYGNPIKVTR